MRVFALSAALAALLVTIAPGGRELDGRQDRPGEPHPDARRWTIMAVAPGVDLSGVIAGQRVVVHAQADEDGYEPATAVTAIR